MKSKVIINSINCKKASQKLWGQYKAALFKKVREKDLIYTDSPGSATLLTRKALMDGSNHIIAVGGDGTINETINGFFDKGQAINNTAVLSFIMLGTGCDFQKSFDLPSIPNDKVKSVFDSTPKAIDIGKLTYQDFSGITKSRYFNNVVSFGMGGVIDLKVNSFPFKNLVGGLISFYGATLQTMLSYKNQQVSISIDSNKPKDYIIRNIAVANGQFQGGGMWIAPEAKLNDGLFDIVIFGDFNRLELALSLPRLYKGTHLTHPKVSFFQGKKIFAKSNETVLLDVDGEALGMLPATFEILPQAVLVSV